MRKIAIVLLAAVACGQGIPMRVLPEETIEKRLRSYTKKNATREPALKTLFEEAGCKDDSLAEQPVKGRKSPNLICTLKGTTDSVIVVGAHFDLIEKGEGVVDNWSGASLLPSLYEGLAGPVRKHTLVFVSFTGEEDGLVGSQFYVKKLGDQRSQVKAMINFDTLGLGPTAVWLSHADPVLANYLGFVAKKLDLPISAVNVDGIGATTDSEPFREKKIPAMTVHSLTQSTLGVLHSPKDNLAAIHMDDYYQTYKLMLAYLAAIDQKLD